MRFLQVFAFFLLISGFTNGIYQNGNQNPVVSPALLKEWVSFLASDQMRGRSNGSPEMETAATWIAEKFKENGLNPLNSIGNYLQNYSYNSRQLVVNEKNVIGYIEGSDSSLKNEYIILSAHFDHIGIRRGAQPDSIYNGADDNASGTCTLIGIAKTLKESGLKPGRSIIFAAFSGEEYGKKGSRYFVANPCVPPGNIYADMNFEMTGHSEFLGKNKYYMTGCLISNLDNLIGEYNRKTAFQLIDTIPHANYLFYASDNITFSRISTVDGIIRGIPSGTFATTTIAPYVHSPSDEAELFDFENMAGLIDYFSKLVIWLSKNNSAVEFTDPRFTKISVHAKASYPDDTIRHYVGELYGGGIVFYVDKTGKHGLICSISDIRGNVDSPLSTRDPNQIQLERQSSDSTKKYQASSVDNAKTASKLCEGYTNSNFGTGIFSDWFLPDINQLEILYKVKSEINRVMEAFDKDAKGLLRPSLYESSSHWDNDRFPGNIHFDFGDGVRVTHNKPSPQLDNVRAIRAF